MMRRVRACRVMNDRPQPDNECLAALALRA